MKYKNESFELFDETNTKCTVIQVDKTRAMNAYNENYTVWFHPCNMRIFNPWQFPMAINRNEVVNASFECIVNQYKYYNCNSQLGSYPIFFIKK